MNFFEQNWDSAKEKTSNHDWEVIEHGWEQHVLVDHVHNQVFRYPRNRNAANKLDDEVAILSALHSTTFNVAIPEIIDHTTEYTVYKYIPGDVLTEQQLANLTDEQASGIGECLGIFFAILHGCSRDIAHNRKHQQEISLLEYYSRRIDGAKTADFYHHARNLLDTIKPDVQGVLVHGDLHSLNMVLDPQTQELSGVIDFSEVEIGDPHQDFRKIFMADPRFLDPAIAIYTQKTGVKIDKTQVQTWAFVNEWANLAYFYGQTEHPTYIRALKHLMQWDEVDQVTAV